MSEKKYVKCCTVVVLQRDRNKFFVADETTIFRSGASLLIPYSV
jgi:hypothetical protein